MGCKQFPGSWKELQDGFGNILTLSSYIVRSMSCAKLMSQTTKNSFFLHCLPAHRGCEVTDEIIDGKNSLVWDEAQNRLYAHQSILLWCLENF